MKKAAPIRGSGVAGNLPWTPVRSLQYSKQIPGGPRIMLFTVILGLLVSFLEKLKRDSKIKKDTSTKEADRTNMTPAGCGLPGN